MKRNKPARLSPIDTSNGYDPYNSARLWCYAIAPSFDWATRHWL